MSEERPEICTLSPACGHVIHCIILPQQTDKAVRDQICILIAQIRNSVISVGRMTQLPGFPYAQKLYKRFRDTNHPIVGAREGEL